MGFIRLHKPLKFMTEKSAVATLEFALLFLPFFLLLMILFETAILIFQIATIDYINAAAAQYASIGLPKDGYRTRFERYIDTHKNKLLLFMDTKNSLQTTLQFCRSLQELENSSCTGNDLENVLIVYTSRYKLHPIFRLIRIAVGLEEIAAKAIYYSERNAYTPTPNTQNPPTIGS
ncbi:hypothetical protein BKH46_05865 [Helicobacter sp. 12S02634-8]|uniref:hypothetical protein n=1 Tax=Helicobacter sp. 12S02634-8 TaxID=1476199 RepID=UPI000BA652B4|nr:hypothetical protein [Helicobacter sp. 12S02634-8]PAF46962.1 hypothetical protein BKH46_05865 [Helicobacter sp. 12S02634-8]